MPVLQLVMFMTGMYCGFEFVVCSCECTCVAGVIHLCVCECTLLKKVVCGAKALECLHV